MKAYTYIEKGRFELLEKPKPEIMDPKDAIVRVTMSSICSSDLHIKHGSVPRAVPGITVGHEMVGVVEQVGSGVMNFAPGDRVTVNVETFCGECFFCRNGYVNNCTDPNGGWALGCRIDGGGRQNLYACRMQTRDSTGFRTVYQISRPSWQEMCLPPDSGQPGYPKSKMMTPSSSSGQVRQDSVHFSA